MYSNAERTNTRLPLLFTVTIRNFNKLKIHNFAAYYFYYYYYYYYYYVCSCVADC